MCTPCLRAQPSRLFCTVPPPDPSHAKPSQAALRTQLRTHHRVYTVRQKPAEALTELASIAPFTRRRVFLLYARQQSSRSLTSSGSCCPSVLPSPSRCLPPSVCLSASKERLYWRRRDGARENYKRHTHTHPHKIRGTRPRTQPSLPQEKKRIEEMRSEEKRSG